MSKQMNVNLLGSLISLIFIGLVALTIFPVNGISENEKLPFTPESQPSSPITVELSIDQAPLINETVTLNCKIASAANAPNTNIEFILPPEAILIEGQLNWDKDLDAEIPVDLSAKIQFPTPGNKSIHCKAIKIFDDSESWGDLDSTYLSLGSTESEFGFQDNDGWDRLASMESAGNGAVIDQKLIFPSKNAHNEEPTNQPPPSVSPDLLLDDTKSEISPLAGSLTVTGIWRYYNRNNSQESEQMLVEIVRGDNNGHLAWCYTDQLGVYSCGPFTNPGSVGVRSRFITYSNFNPNGDVLIVVNPDIGTSNSIDNAFATSTNVQVFSDGTADFGTWVVQTNDNNLRAYWIQSDLIKGWKYIWEEAGSSQSPQETAGSATVEWKIDSTDGTYYLRGGNIYLKGEDPLSNTVVNHEYGHAIMHTIYDGNFPISNCPSPHYIQVASHLNCAWTEGWANLFTIAVNHDPVYRWASGASLNLETPTWGTSGWDVGDDVEGRVAGAIWDMLDDANDGDDTFSEGGFNNIWDTFYHQNDENFREYWAAWLSRGNNRTNAVLSIYQNTIDYRSYYNLDVSKNGTGSGSVTSSPSGINCGSTCSYSFDYATSVTLTAPASSGSTFAGWSGACSGTGPCTVSMTAARSVTAAFNIVPGDDNYEENDTMGTAYDLSTREQQWLNTINGYGIQADNDWYRIYVTPGFNRLKIDARFTHSTGDIDIRLHNSSGTLLAYSDSVTDNEYIDYTVPSAGGYYYIRVYYGNQGNPYNLWWDDVQPPAAGGPDTTGVFRPSNGLLYLKNQNTTGFADIAINYGTGGDYPITGDWDGDGDATIGIYRNGSFYLRNSNTLGFADLVFLFGAPGDQPVAGDWNGDGVDTIGVYRSSTGTFFLRNSNSAGAPEMIFSLGVPGDVGIAGDWNGNGVDTTGVFRPSNGALYLKNTNATGFADVQINYGLPGDKPVTGDWNNDGIDTIGVYRNGVFYLRNLNTIGFADIVFALGVPGDMPIAGNWDGLP